MPKTRRAKYFLSAVVLFCLGALLAYFFNKQSLPVSFDNDDEVKVNLKLLPLKINNNKIYDSEDNEVRLVGVASSLYRFHTKRYTVHDLKRRLAYFKNEKNNLVVLYLDDYKALGKKMGEIVDFCNWAEKEGMYVLLNPVVNGSDSQVFSQEEKYKDTLFSPVDPRLEKLLDELSFRLRNNVNVLYGLGSEPHNINKDMWLTEQNNLINVVRNNSPSSVIVVSAFNWGRDLSIFLQNPIAYQNILYDLHVYVSDYNEGLDITKCKFPEEFLTLPVIVGEFGGTVLGDFGTEEDLACLKNLLEDFNSKKLSFAVYTIDPENDDKFSGLSILDRTMYITPKGFLFKQSLE